MNKSQKSFVLGATPWSSLPSLLPTIFSFCLFSRARSSQDFGPLTDSRDDGDGDDDDDEDAVDDDDDDDDDDADDDDADEEEELTGTVFLHLSAKESADVLFDAASFSSLTVAAAASASAFLFAAVVAFAVAIA